SWCWRSSWALRSGRSPTSSTRSRRSTGCSANPWRSSPRRWRGRARGNPDAALNEATEEGTMSQPLRSQQATRRPGAAKVEMKLEVVVIPVSDVDRAKRFYEGLGWRLDADFPGAGDFRVVQLTPPGSQCSIHFGKGVTAAAPGSIQNLYLVVSDIEAARAELKGHGVDVGETFHFTGFGGKRVP